MRVRFPQFKKYCQEGEWLPKGYGVAYYDFMKLRAIIYPIPFNLILGLLRKTLDGIKNGGWTQTSYERGYLKGYKKGLKEAKG